jgi:hypothetical protein
LFATDSGKAGLESVGLVGVAGLVGVIGVVGLVVPAVFPLSPLLQAESRQIKTRMDKSASYFLWKPVLDLGNFIQEALPQ